MSNVELGAYAPNDLLNERETARFLKLAEATLRNWRALGQGPAFVRVGARRIAYRYAAIEDFIAASTAGG